MYVLSLFEHSLNIELVISELLSNDIERDSIITTTVHSPSKDNRYLDPFNREGLNLFLVSGVGMVTMLLGTIYGFVLYIGPILAALIGLLAGSSIALVFDVLYRKKRGKPHQTYMVDVILIVKCEKDQKEMVEKILADYHTIGLARI